MTEIETAPPLSAGVKADEKRLAEAIGAQIREFRKQLEVTMAEVAHLAGLSVGMLSKIERGVSSPSLSTLTAVAAALNVPVTAFFRKYEEQRDCAYVRAGEGLVIERAGTRAGHEYRLLGHSIRSHLTVEPYLITLTDKSEIFPLFQHPGVEFLYILAGEVLYRHGRKTYTDRKYNHPFRRERAPPRWKSSAVERHVRTLARLSQPEG